MSTTDRSGVIRLLEAQAGIPNSANKRTVGVLQRGTLDVVLGTPARPDEQTPHEQDEVSIVVRGRGVLFHDGKRNPFGPGDFLFVAAATEHRIEDFSDDLLVWRVFYGAKGGEVPTASMVQAEAKQYRLALLLRVIGGVCLLALIPLWMPRGWFDAGHRWLGWGPFPDSPIAEYLARSVSALSGFYGGLLVGLSTDVRRYAPLIRYQAVAIMLLSASGVIVGSWAGMPLWFVGGDAVACWTYCIPMLLLVRCIAGPCDRRRS